MIKHIEITKGHGRFVNETKMKTREGHQILSWLVTDAGGILEIEPFGEDYANGSSDEHVITFHNPQDAITQLTFLIAFLHQYQYEQNPALCSHCAKPIPYDVTQSDPEWKCPECGTQNMGK